MHTRELVELSAFVAAQGRVLFNTMCEIPSTALAQYWMASKCRFDRWNAKLREFQFQSQKSPIEIEIVSRNLRGLGEEILASEMLTRVWSCILISVEFAVGSDEAQPVVERVLEGQLQASNQLLSSIANERSTSASPAAGLNRLRRLTERWTDLLLAGLGPGFSISSFAHNADRASEYARDFVQTKRPALRAQAWKLLMASMKATFESQLQSTTPNRDFNEQIASAILNCFPPEAFDSAAAYHELWMLRLASSTSDTQSLLDQLLAEEASSELAASLLVQS